MLIEKGTSFVCGTSLRRGEGKGRVSEAAVTPKSSSFFRSSVFNSIHRQSHRGATNSHSSCTMTAAIVLAGVLLLLGCRYFGGIASHSVGGDPAFVFPDKIFEAGVIDPSQARDEGSALKDRIQSHRLASSRKLLSGNSCTGKDISISQGRDSSSSGIPQYVVQIVNTCMSDCAPSNIHVFCGWFASAPLVNPKAFRRLNYDDCLVNDGKPLRHGEIIRFQYANSFMYPLRFKSAKFC